MILTPTLAAAYDQALASRMRGGSEENAGADAREEGEATKRPSDAPDAKDSKSTQGSASDGNDS